jgi:hypothetical protein
MAAEYQDPDWRIVDYQPFCLDERIIDRSTRRPLFIRGPRPGQLDKGGYFVALGAAQTFGRFCPQPFPALLAQRLGLPVLNISHGGAGPAFFCKDNARLIDYLNEARFVVVQVMSGRSDSSSLFESEGVGYFRRRSDGAHLGCDEAFSALMRSRPPALLARIVEETRASWCDSYHRLMSQIAVPKVLLWLSTRTPDYRQGRRSLSELFGAFPQLVNARMVAQVGRHCDHYIECVTRRGLPQPLFDRFTGARATVLDPWTSEPWTENWYYPSPEMHQDAAEALEPVCRALSDGARIEPVVRPVPAICGI